MTVLLSSVGVTLSRAKGACVGWHRGALRSLKDQFSRLFSSEGIYCRRNREWALECLGVELNALEFFTAGSGWGRPRDRYAPLEHRSPQRVRLSLHDRPDRDAAGATANCAASGSPGIVTGSVSPQATSRASEMSGEEGRNRVERVVG